MPVEAITATGAEALDLAATDWVGPEFAIDAPPAPDAAPATDGDGFGSMLADQLGALQARQDEAAVQSQALAAGTAEDVGSVVMAVERAQLSMQLAAQLRTKATEAYQEIFRTQV